MQYKTEHKLIFTPFKKKKKGRRKLKINHFHPLHFKLNT